MKINISLQISQSERTLRFRINIIIFYIKIYFNLIRLNNLSDYYITKSCQSCLYQFYIQVKNIYQMGQDFLDTRYIQDFLDTIQRHDWSNWVYCLSKKSGPNSYSNLQLKMGQAFFGILYVQEVVPHFIQNILYKQSCYYRRGGSAQVCDCLLPRSGTHCQQGKESRKKM